MNRQFALKMIGIALLLICLSSLAVNAESAPTTAPMRYKELICNGGFETLDCWRIFDDGVRAAEYSRAIVRSGSRSMRLGIISQGDVYSNANIYQVITIPEGVGSMTLSLWYYPIQHISGRHWKGVSIYDDPGQVLAWEELPTFLSHGWRYYTIDFTPHGSQRLSVWFYIFNARAMYLDDVSLRVRPRYRVHLPLIARR